MIYTTIVSEVSGAQSIFCVSQSLYIPLNPANRHYQEVLDAIIAEGADCFDGDIPADLQAAADEKQFNQQLADYRTATARLAQYVLADGREEVTEMEPTGELDEEGNPIMTTIVVQAEIAPLEATVEVTEYSEDGTATTSVVENPLITQDNAERAAAQAVVDATPEAVITAA